MRAITCQYFAALSHLNMGVYAYSSTVYMCNVTECFYIIFFTDMLIFSDKQVNNTSIQSYVVFMNFVALLYGTACVYVRNNVIYAKISILSCFDIFFIVSSKRSYVVWQSI